MTMSTPNGRSYSGSGPTPIASTPPTGHQNRSLLTHDPEAIGKCERPDRHPEPRPASQSPPDREHHHEGQQQHRTEQCVQDPWASRERLRKRKDTAERHPPVVDGRRVEDEEHEQHRGCDEPEEHLAQHDPAALLAVGRGIAIEMFDPVDLHRRHRRRTTGAVGAVEPHDGRRAEGRLTALILGGEIGIGGSRHLGPLRSHGGELDIDLSSA